MTKNQFERAYLKMPKNFMTPDIKKWKVIGIGEDMRVVELSQGQGFDGSDVWGVSEFKANNSNRYGLESTERADLFKDEDKAYRYYLLLTN